MQAVRHLPSNSPKNQGETGIFVQDDVEIKVTGQQNYKRCDDFIEVSTSFRAVSLKQLSIISHYMFPIKFMNNTTLVTDLPPSTISNKERPENKLKDSVKWKVCQKN